MDKKVEVGKLSCEYLEKPVGIGVERPRLGWQLFSEERNIMQSAYRIQVSKEEPDFGRLSWDSGRVVSGESQQVEYGGDALESGSRYYYRVKIWDDKGHESDWSEPSFWEMGLLKTGEWIAGWIAPGMDSTGEADSPCPLLRRTFPVRKKVKKARVYATALGLYELHMNGVRVGDWLFTPGWTSYNKRLQYQTYDVTELLKQGENVVGAVLGNGWYKGSMGFEGRKGIYGEKLALLFQMQIIYEDGSKEVVASGDSWRTFSGPILMSEIYHGETYDSRLEQDGWSSPGYDDGAWPKAELYEHTKEILIAQENVPVRAVEEVKPIEVIRTPRGETVIDFGQNMVGWVRFTARGAAGTEVVLKHAEVLDRDGNFYTDNIRTARQTIRYILKGEEEEVFEPHFTFQGFRYVKVEEFPGNPQLEDFTGVVIHSDMESTGSFECSNGLVNQLQHNILWGQKGNFLDVPTDCPQRDERLGWTGDAQVFARTACFNMNAAPFFKKWLGDVRADQGEDGAIPRVIPNILSDSKSGGFQSACGWADAATIIPWTLYLCYGDLRILKEQYESMKAYVEGIRSTAEDGLLWNTGFHYGDWLALDAKEGSYLGATPNDLIATAFYAYSTEILADTAALLGKGEDAENYRKLHKDIVLAFRKEFITPSGRLAAPTQTAHVLALMFGLVEEKDIKRTIDTLVKYLEDNKWHLNTGFLGTPYLCHVLSSNGHMGAAYKLLLQADYPSWLYQVKKGATTIWEHWDGIKEDGTFWSANMNSFNHYAYGSIGDWLYRVVAGIDTDKEKAGYRHIIINPNPCEGLQWVRAEFESLYGAIKSGWKIEEGRMEVEIVLPHNTTASVTLPLAELDRLEESSMPAGISPLFPEAAETGSGVKLELGSGSYFFSYPVNTERLPKLPQSPE